MVCVVARATAIFGLAVVLCLTGARVGVAQESVIALAEPVVIIEIADVAVENADIFIDDLQANSYTVFGDGQLTLDLPFPLATRSFQVSVVNRESGARLFAATYRLGLPTAKSVRRHITWNT